MTFSTDDRLILDALVIACMTQFAHGASAADEPEAVIMTVVDILAAKAIVMLEQLTGIDRDVASTMHAEHVDRILAEEPRR